MKKREIYAITNLKIRFSGFFSAAIFGNWYRRSILIIFHTNAKITFRVDFSDFKLISCQLVLIFYEKQPTLLIFLLNNISDDPLAITYFTLISFPTEQYIKGDARTQIARNRSRSLFLMINR